MAFKAKTGSQKHRSHTVEAAISEATKEDIVGMSIKISKTKRSTFKSKTAIENTTMQDVIMQAIDSYIKN
jgi:hypothetical protein